MPREPRTSNGSPVSSRSLRSEAEIDGCGWFSFSATRDTFFSDSSR